MVESFPVVRSAPKPPPDVRVLIEECRALAPLVDQRLSIEFNKELPDTIAVLGPGAMKLVEGPADQVKALLAAAAGKNLKSAQTELHRKLRVGVHLELLLPIAKARDLVDRFLGVMIGKREAAAKLARELSFRP